MSQNHKIVDITTTILTKHALAVAMNPDPVLASPNWLTQRNGGIREGLNQQTVLVTLNGHPMYRLYVTTASGKHTCVVTQTNNGKRLDANKIYDSPGAALNGGLEELRQALGW